MKTSFLKINDFTRRVAMLLFVCVFTSTMVWAQFASTSDKWIIQKSSNNSRCVITDYGGDNSKVTEFPAIVDGIPVVNTSSNVDFKKFPNLETIFMYEGWEYNTMPSAQLCGHLQHIHLVNSSGEVVKEDELPVAITTIPANAFTWVKFETLNIPGVTSIGKGAFYACTELKSINIPMGVTEIGDEIFVNCYKLSSVTLPDGLTSIGACAFLGCEKLTSISIPASVMSIGGSAFDGTGLTSVALSGNPSIGEDAFPASTTLTLNLSPATTVGKENWMTFSNSYANFKADDNTTVYKATTKSNGRLALTEVLDKIVKAETTVFLKSKKSNIVMTRTTDASTDQCDNELQGTDAEIQKIKDGKFDYNYYLTVQIAPDGTGTVDASTYIAAQGEEVELTANAERGYAFCGWSGEAMPASPFEARTTLTMPNRHVTIVANFREANTPDPNTYTLYLVENAGDPAEMAEVHSGIKEYELPSRSRNGYFFLGWATTSNATIDQLVPAFKAGETVELMGNLTLYAIWQKSPAEFADKASNDLLINCISGQTGDIMLKGRTLYKDDNWNTLCLPFSVNDFADTPLEGAIVKELVPNVSSLDDDGILTLNFSDDLTAIEAGKPYIVKWKSGENIVNPVFYDVTISSTKPTAVQFTGGQFVGNYSPFAINVDNIDEIVMLASGNRLGYSKNPRALSSCRAHFVIPVSKVNGSRAISGYVLNFEDGVTTGIIQMSDSSASPSENGGIFSLDGRRFSNVPSQKGVYVVNGKKVVVK